MQFLLCSVWFVWLLISRGLLGCSGLLFVEFEGSLYSFLKVLSVEIQG